jgi:hypothetical protein
MYGETRERLKSSDTAHNYNRKEIFHDQKRIMKKENMLCQTQITQF